MFSAKFGNLEADTWWDGGAHGLDSRSCIGFDGWRDGGGDVCRRSGKREG